MATPYWEDRDAGLAIYCGDCREVLRDWPDGYFSAIVTDPPYGLSREPDMVALLTAWLAGESYNHGSAGFMNSEWDSLVPGPDLWREVARVLKPGGHLLCFAATRTWDLMSLAIRLAGFENRDTIASLGGPPGLLAMQGQGFPKGLDVSKRLDKMAGATREVVGQRDRYRDGHQRKNLGPTGGEFLGLPNGIADITAPASPLAAEWSGWNVNLKPAWEVILCFRKPLAAPNVAANIVEHGTGGLNVDACRVATEDNLNGGAYCPNKKNDGEWGTMHRYAGREYRPPLGRYPPNLLLQHHPDCVRKGTKDIKSNLDRPRRTGRTAEARTRYRMGAQEAKVGHADSPGLETVEDWECHPDCAVRLLAEQSGIRTSGGGIKTKSGRVSHSYNANPTTVRDGRDYGLPDSGTATRFFPQFSPDAPDLTRFRYQSKPPKSERGHGCSALFWRRDKDSPIGYAPIDKEKYDRLGEEERRVKSDTGRMVSLRAKGNIHPTVKSRALLRWLVRLVTPPGGVILDPFGGTGTTGLAAMDEGLQAVLVEREPPYARIAQARLDAWEPQKDKPIKCRQEKPRRPRSHSQPEPGRQVGQIGLFEEASLD